MAPRKSATEAVKKELEKRVEEVIPTELKYRYQFENWEDYHAYKGPKS